MTAAQQTPGPWQIAEGGRGRQMPEGFYVYRKVAKRTEWLRDDAGYIARFDTKASALAKAEGAAS